MRKQISILGSTGFVGRNTLQIAKHFGCEVVALAAKSNIDLLEKQAHEFSPKLIAVYDKAAAKLLQSRLVSIPVLSGMEGLEKVASFDEANFTMMAMTGSSGIVPTIAALSCGKQVGLASKEVLVSAGELISNLSGNVIPVDSELSAIYQCLQGANGVQKLILTASGGPFFSRDDLRNITLEEAIVHPNFPMGPKVAVDSSTLMNKGFEMIAAKWLFGIEAKNIDAVIHPEQKIQSCVEFIDGAIIALISQSDMLLPIQYAINYPERKRGIGVPFDFTKCGKFTFFEPDKKKFRCLQLAVDAMHAAQSYPCFLNAANEVLVDRFLQRNITWNQIFEKLEKLISSHDPINLITLGSILEVDRKAREKASIV